MCPCLTGAADYIKSSMCSNSSCSLNSENPYATIRDPPGLACKHTESSYVEMKSPSHREVPFGGTATLLGGAGRNVYDVGECVVALVCGAQQGPVTFVPSARVPQCELIQPWWELISLDESKHCISFSVPSTRPFPIMSGLCKMQREYIRFWNWNMLCLKPCITRFGHVYHPVTSPFLFNKTL